jgi:hypothetical protein
MMKNPSTLSLRLYIISLYIFSFFTFAPAQTEKAVLILQGGEGIACQIKRISHGYLYFEAATKSLRFKYGDFIETEKIAAVRLGDGRTLTLKEFLAARGLSQPATVSLMPEPQQKSLPEVSPQNALPSPSGPGLRLTNRLLDSTQAESGIGLRLPELSPQPSAAELSYPELANLLAEAGLIGKLLNEINSGVLAGRVLTKSQKELLNAMAQAPAWNARKNALREAHRAAAEAFNNLMQRQPDALGREFRFQPATRKHAFEEFVEFLQTQNTLHFQEKWQPAETLFGESAATALRDILSNYDDWYFLFGEALEKR